MPWSCGTCTLINRDGAIVCEVCESPRPEQSISQSDDEDQRMALAASMHDMQGNDDMKLQRQYRCTRDSLRRTDRHAPASPRTGELWQLNTLNQFGSLFKGSICENQSPSAICGVMAPIYASLLAPILAVHSKEKVFTRAELKDMTNVLLQQDVVAAKVHAMLVWLKEARLAWANKQGLCILDSSKELRHCLGEWVANHEISDYLLWLCAHNSEAARTLHAVHFLRYNQYPERSDARWEEKDRIPAEEKRFGGQREGDKVTVQLEDGASRFIMESFAPQHVMQTPEEWLSSQMGTRDSKTSSCPPVVILDLNGHFCAAIAIQLQTEEEEKRGGHAVGVPTLVVFNTTEAKYISPGCPAAAFDLCFPQRSPS